MKEEEPRNKEYTEITRCRSCSSDKLDEVLSLGEQRIVGFSSMGEETPKVPLTLIHCSNCHLVQLKHTTNPDLLWGDKYWYRSGVNATMREELSDIAQKTDEVALLCPGDIVVDIGANDGTLLASYKDKGIVRVGFDPSRNLIPYFCDTMKRSGIDNFCFFLDYFRANPFLDRYGGKKARAVTAIAMFYDLDDPNKFVEDITRILDRKGVFVIQQNYLGGMLTQNAFDNICHEHLEYYSLLSLERLLARHGLEVFDVSENNINGGSFRTYVGFKGEHDISASLDSMWGKEKEMDFDKKETYENFASRVKTNGGELRRFLEVAKAEGKKVYIYGASTRGNTLLQYCKIDDRLIVAAAERNPDKWGLKITGTGIPIVSEKEARRANPDYFLVLPWYFKTEFLEREKEYLEKGGGFIFPLPQFDVVHK